MTSGPGSLFPAEPGEPGNTGNICSLSGLNPVNPRKTRTERRFSLLHFSVYDLIIVAILAAAVLWGYHKGFVLTLCSFLAVFVGLVGAVLISDLLAEPLMHAITPLVESGIREYLAQIVPDGSASQLDLSDALLALKDSDLYRGFVDALQGLFSTQISDTTTAVISAIASHVALKIAKTVLFVVSFVVVLIAWTIASHVLDLACRLPVLSTLNAWAGAGIGLLKGALLLFIAAWVLKDSFFTPELIDSSILLHFFCTTHPLELIRQFL